MSPTSCIPAMGPAPHLCAAWLPPAWVPVARPALHLSFCCVYPCLAPWLRVTGLSHAEQAPWGDRNSWGDLATICRNTSQDVALLGQDRLSSALLTSRTPEPQTSGGASCCGAISSILGTMRPFLFAMQCLSLPPSLQLPKMAWLWAVHPFPMAPSTGSAGKSLLSPIRNIVSSWKGSMQPGGNLAAAGWDGGALGEGVKLQGAGTGGEAEQGQPCQWPGDSHPSHGCGQG